MAEYKHLRNEVVSNIRKSQQDYYKKKISSDNKPQNIWKAVNESLGKDKKSKLPNDISPDDWNNHFTSAGPKLAKKITDSQNTTWKNNTSIYQFKFNSIMEEDTLKMLQNFPSSNNIDVLGFDSLLLNLSSDVICSGLTVLFNMSLNTGQIPDDWKKTVKKRKKELPLSLKTRARIPTQIIIAPSQSSDISLNVLKKWLMCSFGKIY